MAEGVSRAERMKLLKREGMSSRLEELERVLNVLRSGSDIEASTLLARLRLGERMDNIAKSLPPAAPMLHVSKPPRYAEGRSPTMSCVAQLNNSTPQLTNPGVWEYIYKWRQPGVSICP